MRAAPPLTRADDLLMSVADVDDVDAAVAAPSLHGSWIDLASDEPAAPAAVLPDPHVPPPRSKLFYTSEDIDDDFVLISGNE